MELIQIDKFVTKTNLNKIIKWSSSKYCEYRKEDIVKKVMNMKVGETFNCSTGSYTENNSWGYGYKFTRTTGYLVIECIGGKINILAYKE